jgi:predicted DNA-binding transcriptional regulator AlpA
MGAKERRDVALTTTDASNGNGTNTVMTLTEIATMLAIPVSTLRTRRSEGIGPPGHAIGRHVRYLRVEVLRWVAAQPDRVEQPDGVDEEDY